MKTVVSKVSKTVKISTRKDLGSYAGLVWFGLVGFSFNASLEPQPSCLLLNAVVQICFHYEHEDISV